MDCEKFDQHVMDALYDELDELTHAAMKRHMDSCARCASAFAGLRATRDVGILPLEEPSEDLEARILEAVAVAQKKTPFHRKALRALAWAGSHAMRPQLAMAALFVLVIGSSLLLLRAKPGTVGVAPVRVTERGVPVPDQPEPPREPVAQAPAAAALPGEPIERRVDEASKDKGERGSAEQGDGAIAALKEAQALQKASGCAAALSKFDEIGARYPGTAVAHTAMWEAARCYRAAGDEDKARELLLALQSAGGYRERAEKELASLEESSAKVKAQNSPLGSGGGAGASPAPSTAGGAAPGSGSGKAAAATQARAAPRAAAAPAADEAQAPPSASKAPAEVQGAR